MSANSVTLMGVGDLGFNEESDYGFKFVVPVLKTADVVVGQVETPYTTRPDDYHDEFFTRVKTRRDPQLLQGLTYAGFNIVTLAGNHVWDAGLPGIEDTINTIKSLGIAFVGAGMNIDEARKPAIMECKGTRIGFLDYCCTGPKSGWATPEKPGCAYVHIITSYELDHANPGGTPVIYTWAETESQEAMLDDISKLRPLCDVLVVCFHKGIVHTPIKLAGYERPLCHTAIDAGADLILSGHAHILRGVEFYKGKPIFHGLSNFSAARGMGQWSLKPDTDPKSWTARRRQLYSFEPDPMTGMHPDAKYTIIAKFIIEDRKISRVSYFPCLFYELQLLKHDERGQEVFDYMEKITRAEGLNARYKWEGDEVAIYQD